MKKPVVKSFFDPATFTVSHVVCDPVSGETAVIDPVLDYEASSGRTHTHSADRIVQYIKNKGLALRYIIETHAHADHLSGAPFIKSQLGGDIIIGAHIDSVQKSFGPVFNVEPEFKTDGSQFDRLVSEEEILPLGSLSIRAMHTPGHTAACMSYLIGDALFVGDTLFMPDYGSARCDFPGGDAGTLYDSIQKLFALPDATRMFLCHDYKAPGRDEFAWETTIGEQKAANIHLKQGTDRDAFIKMRTERDKGLKMPALILPSVQVNIRAGKMPPAENNGTVYLKVPVDVL